MAQDPMLAMPDGPATADRTVEVDPFGEVPAAEARGMTELELTPPGPPAARHHVDVPVHPAGR